MRRVIFLGLVIVGAIAVSEAEKPSYGRDLSNFMSIAGVPQETIEELLALPQQPMPNFGGKGEGCLPPQKWLWVSPDFRQVAVFHIEDTIDGVTIYDLNARARLEKKR